MKKNLILIIRLSVTLILILYLAFKIQLSKLWSILLQTDVFLFLFASFLYIVSSYLSTLRWRLFISSNSAVSLKRLFSLYMIGCFFNIFLPGIMGGDVVKILLLRKTTGLKEAIGSVFTERYIGFFALLLIGVLFFLIFYRKMPENWSLYLVPLSFMVFIIGTVILYFSGKIPILKEIKNHVFGFTTYLYLKAFLYSLFVQFTVMISVYFIFLGLNVNVKFYEVVVYLPIIIILSTLPISISGIGVREWSFVVFFGTLHGDEKALAVSLLWFLSVCLASLVGGFEYLRFKDFFDMGDKKQSL